MLTKALLAWCLMATCIAIHAGGLTSAVRWFQRQPSSFWGWTWHFTCIAGWLVVLHLLEISAWAVFYVIVGAFDNLASALYFSVVTYTTTGYGDLVLPPPWRLVGGVEALTGILMCGWSTGFFVAVVSRMFSQIRTTTA